MNMKSSRWPSNRKALACGAVLVAALSANAQQPATDETRQPGQLRPGLAQPGQPGQLPGQSQSQSPRQYGQTETMTAEQFAQQAALGSLKEICVGKLAQEKTQNSQVRAFAARMVSDHTRANEELTKIAQQKGITLPEATSFDKTGSDRQVVSGRIEDRNVAPTDRNAAPTDRNAVPNSTDANRTDRDRERDTSRSGSGAGPGKDLESAKSMHQQHIDHLRSLSGDEFDRAFGKHMVQDHQKAVAKFTKASESLEDAELKSFAAKTLPTLQQHLTAAQQLPGAPDAGGLQNPGSPGSITDPALRQNQNRDGQPNPGSPNPGQQNPTDR
jgi:predicted outer membrane protein